MNNKTASQGPTFELPGVISSQVADRMPVPPKTNEEWRELHLSHVQRLQSAWGSIISKLGLDGVIIHSGVSPLKYSRDDQYWPTAPCSVD